VAGAGHTPRPSQRHRKRAVIAICCRSGARLYQEAALLTWRWSGASTQLNWFDALAIWRGRLAIHGALIGAGTLRGIVLFAAGASWAFWNLLDVLVPVVAGPGDGRWANFFNSEAFWLPTNLPGNSTIPHHRPAVPSSELSSTHLPLSTFWNLVFWPVADVFSTGERARSRCRMVPQTAPIDRPTGRRASGSRDYGP